MTYNIGKPYYDTTNEEWRTEVREDSNDLLLFIACSYSKSQSLHRAEILLSLWGAGEEKTYWDENKMYEYNPQGEAGEKSKEDSSQPSPEDKPASDPLKEQDEAKKNWSFDYDQIREETKFREKDLQPVKNEYNTVNNGLAADWKANTDAIREAEFELKESKDIDECKSLAHHLVNLHVAREYARGGRRFRPSDEGGKYTDPLERLKAMEKIIDTYGSTTLTYGITHDSALKCMDEWAKLSNPAPFIGKNPINLPKICSYSDEYVLKLEANLKDLLIKHGYIKTDAANNDAIHRTESLSERAHRLIHELAFILPDLDQSLHDIISKESLKHKNE